MTDKTDAVMLAILMKISYLSMERRKHVVYIMQGTSDHEEWHPPISKQTSVYEVNARRKN